MNKNLTPTQAQPRTKKVWQKPDFEILDSDTVDVKGSFPSYFEAGKAGSQYYIIRRKDNVKTFATPVAYNIVDSHS